MMGNKKEKGTEGFVGRAFIICLIAAVLLNIFHPAGCENIDLLKAREFSVEELAFGAYAHSFENRLRSGICGRDLLCKARTALRRFGGSKKENGVFTGKGGQLLADIATPDKDAVKENVHAIKDFAGRHPVVPMTMILVPDAADILKDSLPRLAVTQDQNNFISAVKKSLAGPLLFVDAAKALSGHKDEKIYYKTDRRWTSAGAFYVFLEAAGTLGIEGDVASVFASYPVSADFVGDLAKISKVCTAQKERIDIYVPKDLDNDMIVNYADIHKRRVSLYASEKLESRDKYDVFLGGDTSLIHIETMSARKNRLLIIKDSFANCFIQFLTPFFREIVAVDPAYFSGDVDDIMDMYNITDVIFLYEGNTFFTDKNLSGVLKGGEPDKRGLPYREGADEAE